MLNSEITTAWENCLAAAKRYGSYVAAIVFTMCMHPILRQHCTELQVTVAKPLLALLTGCMVFLAIGVHLLDDSVDRVLLGLEKGPGRHEIGV